MVMVGALAGMYFGKSMNADLDPRLEAENGGDPVDRFELGRDSYAKGAIRVDPRQNVPMRNDATELGVVKDGARVLVPYEPARQKERADAEADEAWQNESFPEIENPDDFHYFDED